MVSPERYAGEVERELSESEIYGEYEFITVKDNYVSKDLGGTASLSEMTAAIIVNL